MPNLGRQLAYPVALHPGVERFARAHPRIEALAYRRAERYVGGRTLQEALRTVDRLNTAGLSVSLDRFGEGQRDPRAIEQTVADYEAAAQQLRERDADADLEVVPSNLGIDTSVKQFCAHALRVARGLPRNARLQISAEESHRTPRIIDAAVQLAENGTRVVVTLQANLRRTGADVDRVLDAGAAIRLVKGAYLEAPDVAHSWGEPTDRAFIRLAHHIRGRGGALSLATHDPVIRDALLDGPNDTGVEMLLGVRTEDALDLVRASHHVRVYVPYGEQWFRYWMRRLVESLGA